MSDAATSAAVKCPECDMVCENARGLAVHRARAHGFHRTVNPIPIDLQAKCPECGRIFRRGVALATHRRKAHGLASPRVAGNAPTPHRRKPAARRPQSAPRGRPAGASRSVSVRARPCSSAPAGDLADLFAALTEVFTGQQRIIEDCLAGLEELLSQAKALRLAYLKSQGRIAKLRAIAQSSELEPVEDPNA